MDPLVSILIPAYNSEAWIADTLRSALGQAWRRKEIVVVDDGSRDRTLAVAQGFTSEGVCVVAQNNQGAAAARNRAFSLCQGDYIQWLDADDLLAPNKITEQMKALEGYGARTLLSSAWGHFFYRPSKARFIPTELWGDLAPAEWLLRKLDGNLYMQPATWLVSRELTQAAGPWDTRLSLDDDGEYFCRVLMASEGTHFVPQAKVFYRRSGFGSLSKIGGSDKKLESQFLAVRLHLEYIRALEDSARVRRACLKYLQRWLIFFYPQRPDLVEQLESLAATVGGRLELPRLPRKYAWIQELFGWEAGKRAWECLPKLKALLDAQWDKVLYRLERDQPSASGTRHDESGTCCSP